MFISFILYETFTLYTIQANNFQRHSLKPFKRESKKQIIFKRLIFDLSWKLLPVLVQKLSLYSNSIIFVKSLKVYLMQTLFSC